MVSDCSTNKLSLLVHKSNVAKAPGYMDNVQTADTDIFTINDVTKGYFIVPKTHLKLAAKIEAMRS